MKASKHPIIATLIFLIYLFANIPLLSHYGMNWDTQYQYRGQAFLHYFLTGSQDYSNLKGSLDTRSSYQSDKADFNFWKERWTFTGHPPFGDMAASVSNMIFYQKLKILPDIESYHLYSLLTSALMISVVYLFTSNRFGVFPGLVSVLTIITYPLFFAESHFNLKDPLQAGPYAAALYLFYRGVTLRKAKLILWSAVFAGIALATKFNILFGLLTLTIWLLVKERNRLLKLKWPFAKKITISLFLYPIIALAIFFVSWPSAIPVSKIGILVQTVKYYKDIGFGLVHQSDTYLTFFNFNTYPALRILYTTPLITLFLSALGFRYLLKTINKDKFYFGTFVLLWLFISILRVSLPNASIYGGVRQIMEYIPALAILAGAGTYSLISIIEAYPKMKQRRVIVYMLIIIAFIPITKKLTSIHPNENIYFNPIIGGLKGSFDIDFPDWGNSYGNTYRQGANWLNIRSEQNAQVTTGLAYVSALPSIWLREDVQVSNNLRSGILRNGEYIVERTENRLPDTETYYTLEYAHRFLEPVYQVKIDGISILSIWKNDLTHTKPDYRSIPGPFVLGNENVRKETASISIDLRKDIILTDLGIESNDPKCILTTDDILYTSYDGVGWQLQKRDLEGSLFSLKKIDYANIYFYFFAGRIARYIRIDLAEDRPCLNLNRIYINKLGSAKK